MIIRPATLRKLARRGMGYAGGNAKRRRALGIPRKDLIYTIPIGFNRRAQAIFDPAMRPSRRVLTAGGIARGRRRLGF